MYEFALFCYVKAGALPRSLLLPEKVGFKVHLEGRMRSFSVLPCQSLKDKRLRGGDPSLGSASSGKLLVARDDKREKPRLRLICKRGFLGYSKYTDYFGS